MIWYDLGVMKMQLRLNATTEIEIQGDPGECVVFVRGLMGTACSEIQENTPEAAVDQDETGHVFRVHRRDKILLVMKSLKKKGIEQVTLQEIITGFKQLYPKEDTRNLDQVVRDLANKTNLVQRVGRAHFALT